MENNEKIYGIYAGPVLKVDKLEECDEYEVWGTIQNLGNFIFYTNHNLAHGRIDGCGNYDARKDIYEDLENAQYALEYAVYFTKKFGVTFNREPKAGEHIQRSESYNKWYRFWNDHFNNMSDEDYKEFERLQRKGEDVSKYLPKARWNEEENDM